MFHHQRLSVMNQAYWRESGFIFGQCYPMQVLNKFVLSCHGNLSLHTSLFSGLTAPQASLQVIHILRFKFEIKFLSVSVITFKALLFVTEMFSFVFVVSVRLILIVFVQFAISYVFATEICHFIGCLCAGLFLGSKQFPDNHWRRKSLVPVKKQSFQSFTQIKQTRQN